MRVIIKDEDVSITVSNNVTADTFSLASSSQRENLNAIFTSEKLEKLDEPVDAVKKMTRKKFGYDLNTATARYSQVSFASDLDTVTHTSNVILDQNLLSCRTIGEVSVLPLPPNPSISAIKLAPQTLMTPPVQ